MLLFSFLLFNVPLACHVHNTRAADERKRKKIIIYSRTKDVKIQKRREWKRLEKKEGNLLLIKNINKKPLNIKLKSFLRVDNFPFFVPRERIEFPRKQRFRVDFSFDHFPLAGERGKRSLFHTQIKGRKYAFGARKSGVEKGSRDATRQGGRKTLKCSLFPHEFSRKGKINICRCSRRPQLTHYISTRL